MKHQVKEQFKQSWLLYLCACFVSSITHWKALAVEIASRDQKAFCVCNLKKTESVVKSSICVSC